jgi:hypothetical protein
MSFLPRPHAFPTYARPAVGDPVPIVPQAAAPRPVDPHAAAPRTPTRLTLSVRTSTEAARGTLCDAIGALGGVLVPSSVDVPRSVERWADAGGPLAPTMAEYPTAESPGADNQFRRRPGCGSHDVRPSARDAAYAALGAYARALRHDGLPFAAALAAVGTAVDHAADVEAAGLLPPALLAAVQRDATQCCRAVFAAA